MLESLVRLRKELAKFRQTAASILFWAETLDELSIEHLAASLLEEPGYSIAVEEEYRQQREQRGSVLGDPFPVKSDDD